MSRRKLRTRADGERVTFRTFAEPGVDAGDTELCRQDLLHLGNIHILVAGISILLFGFLHFSFEIRLLRLFPGRLGL